MGFPQLYRFQGMDLFYLGNFEMICFLLNLGDWKNSKELQNEAQSLQDIDGSVGMRLLQPLIPLQ